MARYSLEEAEKLAGSLGYFSIRENGEKAKIRILYKEAAEVEVVDVHRVEYKGRNRNIECVKEHPEDSDENCPFCNAGIKISRKIFVPVYDINESCVKIWEKGITFTRRLFSLFANYPNLWEEIIEVQRIDGRNDLPDYKISVITDEYDRTDAIFDFDISDIDIPDIATDESNIMLTQKSKPEMEYFLKNGKFEDDAPSQYTKKEQYGQSNQNEYRRRGQPNETSEGSSNSGNNNNSGYSSRTNRRREF